MTRVYYHAFVDPESRETMKPMHYVGRAAAHVLQSSPTHEAFSRHYTQHVLVGAASGAVHTHLTLNELAAGGHIAPHMHAAEEGFYILEGEAVVGVAGSAFALRPGDFGAFTYGTVHAWHNPGPSPLRWFQISMPQPKPAGAERDTWVVRDGVAPTTGRRFDDGPLPEGVLLAHFGVDQIPPPGEARAGLAMLPGVFLKWLIDEAFGARHHRMLLIEYQPGVSIALHDHTFEEGYFILSGEVHAVLDGRDYALGPGDVVWTSVGCVHSFANVGQVPVRWLETFAPQPPAEHVFRFMHEWAAKGAAIEG
jgi:mannose-6-phosphate isomerase-like protein (cupin superfamily)